MVVVFVRCNLLAKLFMPDVSGKMEAVCRFIRHATGLQQVVIRYKILL